MSPCSEQKTIRLAIRNVLTLRCPVRNVAARGNVFARDEGCLRGKEDGTIRDDHSRSARPTCSRKPSFP